MKSARYKYNTASVYFNLFILKLIFYAWTVFVVLADSQLHPMSHNHFKVHNHDNSSRPVTGGGNWFRVYRSVIRCVDVNIRDEVLPLFAVFSSNPLFCIYGWDFSVSRRCGTQNNITISVYRKENWTKTPLCGYTICNHCLSNHKHVHCIHFYFLSSRGRTIFFESCQMGMILRLNRCDEICMLIQSLKS